MILQKVFLNPVLQKQIDTYRKLSLFITKYGLVIVAFVISIFFSGINLVSQDNNIVSYSNSVVFDKLKQSFIGKYQPFKKSVKKIYLEGNLIFSNTNADKPVVNLGLGLFKSTGNLQIPSFSKFNYLLLKGLNNKDLIQKANNYLLLLNKISYTPGNFKLNNKENTLLDITQIRNKYNLACMDTFLKDSVFCNANKFYLINDILHQNIDLNSNTYNLLFDNLFISNQDKCLILKKIFSFKLNYSNIKDVIDKYCDDSKMFMVATDIISNYSLDDLFNQKVPLTIEGQLYKLTNQWFYLLKNSHISSDIINSHISYVKTLMDNFVLDKFTMYIEYKILKKLQNKIEGNVLDSTKSSIDFLIKGNMTTGFKGLSYYLNDLLATEKNEKDTVIDLLSSTDNVKSVREKLLKLITNYYGKYFELIAKPTKDTDIQSLTGNLIIYEQQNNKVYSFKLPVVIKINIKSVIGKKFKILDVKILDKKVLNYLNTHDIKLTFPIELVDLSTFLSKILSNYYLNGGKEKLDLCAKAKLLGFTSCNKNVIIVQKQKPNYSLNFYFSGENIKKVSGPNIITLKLNYEWVGKETLNIYLSQFLNRLNKIIDRKDYNLYSINKIVKLVSNYIKNEKAKIIKQKVGLTPVELVNIASLLKKYLNARLVKTSYVKNNIYKLYFTLDKYRIISLYDKKRNVILSIGLYSSKAKKIVVLGKVNIVLSPVALEKLNQFKSNPDVFFKGINSTMFNKYLTLEN